MNDHANPAEWNKIGALPFDGTRGAEPRQVPGIPPVSQPLSLARDEYVCAGCGAPIMAAPAAGQFEIIYSAGCGAVAQIVEEVRGA